MSIYRNLIWVFVVVSIAVTLLADGLPPEMARLALSHLDVSYYCPRCGRNLDINNEAKTFQIRQPTDYTKLVDQFAGPCITHRWEYASSTDMSQDGKSCGDGYWQFKGFAKKATANKDFLSLLRRLGALDTNECCRVMTWFCSLPFGFPELEQYMKDEEIKTAAMRSLTQNCSLNTLDISSQVYQAWSQKWITMEKEAPNKSSVRGEPRR